MTGRDLHKRVGYRHGCNDHDIHEQRDGNDTLVEANQSVILSETVANEVRFDGLEKVPVECGIDDEVQEFLDTIPVLVDDVVLVADLETRWYPDGEDTEVDSSNEHGSGNHDLPRAPAVGDNDTDTVDDDLQQQLNLDTPPEENGEVESKTW